MLHAQVENSLRFIKKKKKLRKTITWTNLHTEADKFLCVSVCMHVCIYMSYIYYIYI